MSFAAISLMGPGALASDRPPAVATGWQEAMVVVADLSPWVETLSTVGGWEIAWRGSPSDALNGLWGLPSAARTEQVLMRNIGTQAGFIRLIKVEGVSQTRIRADDQAWETGGVQALDLRVVDMEATSAALHDRGWRAPAEPIRYTVYGVEVIQWVPVSPDGVRLSFIQRIRPALVGWTELKRWSRASNAAITVKDVSASVDFFHNVLGMAQVSSATNLGSGGPNVLGLPWPVAEHLAVDIRGFAGATPGGSAIELVSMPSIQGRDHAQDAHPPNLGIAGLRFTIADLDAARTRLTARATQPSEIFAMDIPPYGACRAFAARAPDGVWLEFIQPAH